jgi:methyl-accepting chemotaxis protein
MTIFLETLQEQFDNIKKLIKLNLESINSLIEQSDSLKKMIENTDSLDDNTRQNLSKIRDLMVGSINDLIEHTDSLFTSYDNIIDKLASK